MLTKDVENLFYATAFFRARIEFSIRVGTCPTLAEAVVAFAIDRLHTTDGSQVTFALMNVLATF